MRVAHSHGQAGVSQDPLQGEDVPALLHKVAGKGVTEFVGRLALRQFGAGTIQGAAEGVDSAGSELALALPVIADQLLQSGINWHGTHLAGFGLAVGDSTITQTGRDQSICLRPTRSGRQTDQGVVVRRVGYRSRPESLPGGL